MLSTNIENALNDQIAMEGYASFLYLSMASWADRQGLEGCAKFLHRQSNEERSHMLRLFHYIIEMDGTAVTPAIKQPPLNFDSVDKLFREVYEHEQRVTKSINDIVALCYKETDHSTLNFLQWYVEEQREEESLMRNILDKIRLIGDSVQSLYFIDQELEKINKAQDKVDLSKEAGAA